MRRAGNLLKRIMMNIIALVIAAAIGMVAASQVIYMHEIPTGRIPLAPLVMSYLVTIILSAVAPRTRFMPRLLVFTGVHLGELLLAVLTTAATIWLVNSYFNGDPEAAKLWRYGGAVTPFIVGGIGYWVLVRYRSDKEEAKGKDSLSEIFS